MATTISNTEEMGAMPSFFQSIKQSESHPVASWKSVVNYITQDPAVEYHTRNYRKRLAISKAFADEIKSQGPAITVSAMMDGYGRKLENFAEPTYMLMVECDNVSPSQLERSMVLLENDDYVFLAHRSLGGKGVHIFCKYQAYPQEDIPILDLFGMMVTKAQQHFEQLLGLECDKACSDITRCAGLAHDPEAYFNPDSMPFSLDEGDWKRYDDRKVAEAKRAERMAKRKTAQKNKGGVRKMAEITVDEVATHVREMLRQWGYAFEPGRHNEYVYQFGMACLRYGLDKDEVLKYAAPEFGNAYPDTASVIKACYKHTEKMGTWHYYRPGEGYGAKVTVRTMKQWLSMHYEFQHNVVTGFYEVRSRMVDGGKYLRFTRIDDSIENSIWAEMDEAGLKVSDKTLHHIINSDFSKPYDPLTGYLNDLPRWVRGEHPDYIDQLADCIHVKEKPGYEHTQELFRYFFKKWMVAMVVAWGALKVVNQFVLILVGKGGIFKTTFFNFLLPPELREYFFNDSSGNYADKDFQEACSSKATICLDEFESVFGKNLSAFKSNLTKLTFSIRRPYDKYRSELPHRASLCGTTNSQQFITDEENRRYSPWIVESIDSPIDHPIDYEHVYAQAIALGQEVMERSKVDKKLDWTFWLTTEDIDLMRRHNRLFMMANYAEEQIMKYYRVPQPDTDLRYIKFRYTSEILEKIGVNPVLRQNLNNHNIGFVMARLGFKKIHKMTGNGWAVIEKEDYEINCDAMVNPTDTVEE